MPSSSSRRSSTAHWVERARRGHLAADQQRDGVERRVAQQRHGRLELAEAERDRAGGVGGQQQRVVDAVRDVRLDRRRAAHAHLLHRREQLDRVRAARARARGVPGVMPAVRRVISRRGVSPSTSMRAKATSSSAIASSATARSMPRRAMNSSSRSNSASGLPSSSTTRPSSMRSDGSGSFGLANAISPSAGSSGTRLSRLIGRVA